MSLDGNLTGEQIQQVLDNLLYSALYPIIDNTHAFDAQLLYILVLISRNKKRKICSLDRLEAIDNISIALSTEDTDLKMQCIRKSKIERVFVHSFIHKIIEASPSYLSLYDRTLRSNNSVNKKKLQANLSVIENNSCCYPGKSLYPIMVTSVDYLAEYFKFRSTIFEHYLKSVSKSVKSYINMNKAGTYDYNDIRQNMLRGTLTAIDKYDSSKGALTSYINWWLLNAQTCNSSEHEYGIAYTVPQAHKKKMANSEAGDINFSVSLDSILSEDGESTFHNVVGSGVSNSLAIVESNQQEQLILYLAKRADTKGIARISLDLGEYFSTPEKEKMLARMKRDFKSKVTKEQKEQLFKTVNNQHTN